MMALRLLPAYHTPLGHDKVYPDERNWSEQQGERDGQELGHFRQGTAGALTKSVL